MVWLKILGKYPKLGRWKVAGFHMCDVLLWYFTPAAAYSIACTSFLQSDALTYGCATVSVTTQK